MGRKKPDKGDNEYQEHGQSVTRNKEFPVCEPPYPYPGYRPLFCPGLLRHRNSERNSDSNLQTGVARYGACCRTGTFEPTCWACQTRFGHVHLLAGKGVTIVEESLRSNGSPSVDVTVFITVIY
jgi:hypothetical protein